jgi:peptidoglycan/xylan/chitin deacetylase (PgdA/CDA1 family)
MQHGFPGQQRPADTSPLTRRGLLGAAVLVIAGGVAEVVHSLGRSTPARTVGSPRSVANILARPSTPSRATAPASSPPAAAPPVTHHHEHVHGRTAPHAHAHSHPLGHPRPTHSHGAHHASHHASHHTDGHAAHGHHHASRQREEPVTLPPPRLAVRSAPAYQVDQLIKSPPRHAIALTIDDGPDPEWTPHVLRLLDRHHMQASFCVVGLHAAAYPRLVRDIARAGHVIVNHSYTHTQPFNHLTEKRIVWEITKTQHTIEKAAKVTPLLFRAPGGDWSHFIYRACAAYGLEPLDWDVDPRDWALPGTRRIERRMLRAKPGEIVLCHDGGGNRAQTVRALRHVLPTWKRRGLTTMPLEITPHWLPRSSAHAPSPSPSPTSDPSR